MKNAWINKITGQPVTEARIRAFGRSPRLRPVLGEAEVPDDMPEETPTAPETPPAAEPAVEPSPIPALDDAPPEAELDAGAEPGMEAPDDGSEDNQVVRQLVSTWESGSQMDVATRLLYTPVSYMDFAQMLFRIGPESAMELGAIMDEMSEKKAGINQPEDADAMMSDPNAGGDERILAQVAARRNALHTPVAPAGDTGTEQEGMP